jgi:hypothetical protein
MSHTSAIKSISIQSVSALRAAVEELATTGVKCSLVENAKPRAYFSNQQGLGVADFVLQLHDAQYDVGFYKTEDGKSYEARTDFWGKSVESVLGACALSPENAMQAKLGKLYQLYGIAAATEQARKKGHMVRRIPGKDGSIKLEVTNFA